MHLESLKLINFKNYAFLSEGFTSDVNCITGMNGSGKTNLLDAIYFLSVTKSAFHHVDNYSIKNGERFFHVSGNFSVENNGQEKITGIYKQGEKKEFRRNGNAYEKISNHIGLFPVVFLTPYDNDLVREGSEARRKFFDALLCQTDKVYLEKYLRYNAALKRRGELLKKMSEWDYPGLDLLEPYDHILIQEGKYILEARIDLMKDFRAIHLKHYSSMSHDAETVGLAYMSKVEGQNYENIFKNSLRKDLLLKRTTIGIHRDDFEFSIRGQALKRQGSQGQQKSYIIALKLAQFEMLTEHKGFKPILLMDDIFDKLDNTRINRLVELVVSHTFGQIFMTESRSEKILKVLEALSGNNCQLKLHSGKVISKEMLN